MTSPLIKVSTRPETNSQRRHSDAHSDDDDDHSADHEAYYYDSERSIHNLCLDWFSEGVRSGKKLQRDKDHERLSRYKTRMRAQATKYEKEVLLRERYHDEVDFLKAQLFTLKDELVAAHAAYEELALSVATSSPRSESHSDMLEASPQLNVSAVILPETEESSPMSQHMQCMVDGDHLVDDADQSRFKNSCFLHFHPRLTR
jgi:hypothetical protein